MRIKIIVNGTEIKVNCTKKEKIATICEKALKQTGQSYGIDRFQLFLHDAEHNDFLLDRNKSLLESKLKITENDLFFLSLKSGTGA